MRPSAGRALRTLVAGAAVAAAAAGCRQAAAEPSPALELKRLADIVLAPDSEIQRALVPPRTTLSALLAAHQLASDEAAAVIDTIAGTFDLRRVRAGQPYRLNRFFDGRLREFAYEIDLDRMLVVRRRESAEAPAFDVALAPIPKTVQAITVHGAIDPETPSLVQALDAAGERIELSLALADLFAGEMDFTSDLQPGDAFRLIVERATREDGEFGGYGPVLAAEYVSADRQLRAIRYTPADGKAGYYDADGRSLKRFFLKSPLKFEPRITSRFSRARRHPILNYTRAHNGVDYAAPPGAPVGAVASGVVMVAGWTGGGGRTVRIRHASGYQSEYLHLSSIAPGIRAGRSVAQGELIGRVGSSGLATGPHLHYGLRRNGAYVNPVAAHRSMPPGDPIGTDQLAAFEAERDRLLRLLEPSPPR